MYRYGNVSTCNRVPVSVNLLPQGAAEDCPTLATVAGGADVTPYEDEDEPETDEDEDDVDDSDPKRSYNRGVWHPIADLGMTWLGRRAPLWSLCVVRARTKHRNPEISSVCSSPLDFARWK